MMREYPVQFCERLEVKSLHSTRLIILNNDITHLQSLITLIREFLFHNLRLELHPRKVTIAKLSSGIDFLGYVLFEHHTLVRTRTKQRMKRRLHEAFEKYLIGITDPAPMDQKLQSYLGILSHANEHTLALGLENAYWVRNGKCKIFLPEEPAKKPKYKMPKS